MEMGWQRFFVLGAAAAMATMGATTVAEAGEAEGWILSGGPGAEVGDGTGFNLYNMDQKGYLDYKDRWGANLGWTKSPTSNIELKRKPGAGTGPLKCGETFAFKVDSEWVIYGKQRFGINLTTRTKLDDSGYQWKITKCTAGQAIAKGAPVSLTNTKENDALVGCKRPAGVNLAWSNDVEVKFGVCVRTKKSL
jgi:hypothetical protein